MISSKNLTTLLFIWIFMQAVPVYATGDVTVIYGDDPSACLAPESLFINDGRYFLVDGRNNLARIKIFSGNGTLESGIISTIPLPDAASLPPDILPSPWGMDRIAITENYAFAVPASWVNSSAEIFELQSGNMTERTPDAGMSISGMTVGPEGNAWAVGRRFLLNLGESGPGSINLSSTFGHIDSAVGHPFGFVVLEQPDIVLVESSGLVRWSVSLDDGEGTLLSPIDIACGPDGTIAICAIMCDLTVPEDSDEYYRLRGEAMMRDDEEVLFAIEDALRSNLGFGFVLVVIGADGTMTDIIDLSAPPVACAVDDIGRVHVLSNGPDRWVVSILDTRLQEGFEVFDIPHGVPGLISPHRLAEGPGGNLYWDDVTTLDGEEIWGIARLNPNENQDVFSLGHSNPPFEWIYTEPLTDFIRQTTAIEVTPDAIYISCQDFGFDILNDPSLAVSGEEAPYTPGLLKIGHDGILREIVSPPEGSGASSFASDIVYRNGELITSWAASILNTPVAILDGTGEWRISLSRHFNGPVANAHLESSGESILGWFAYPEENGLEMSVYDLGGNLDGSRQEQKLSTLDARLLASDPSTGRIWVTIDDGEIFEVNPNSMYVSSYWPNRINDAAPAHVLDSVVYHNGELAILDREHRAVISVNPDAFIPSGYSYEEDINEATGIIRTAFWQWRNTYGSWPSPSPDVLDEVLDYDDREVVRQAFLGGRIYNYRIDGEGYTFTAWGATSDQAVYVCTHSDTQVIY